MKNTQLLLLFYIPSLLLITPHATNALWYSPFHSACKFKNHTLCSVNKVVEQTRLIEMEHIYQFTIEGKPQRIEFKLALPKDYDKRQKVKKIEYSRQASMTVREGGTDYAIFIITRPKEDFELKINYQIALFRYDLTMAEQIPNTIKTLKKRQYKKYTRIESDLKIKDKNLVPWDELTGKNQAETVYNIHEFVENQLFYSSDFGKNKGADYAIKEGKGDCSEYSDLMVSLCRYKDIPARTISGFTYKENSNNLSFIGQVFKSSSHSWVEVFLDDLGWIPFDPTHSDESRLVEFDKLQNKYIYITFSKLNHLYSWRWSGSASSRLDATTTRVKVERNISMKAI